MTDLLPCPFCGGAAYRCDVPTDDDTDPNAGGSFIQCVGCSASSALHFDRKEHLVTSWNERAYLKRGSLARHLAALDGVRLLDVRSTVSADAGHWREYLGRADDLLSMISEEMVENPEFKAEGR